MQASRRVVVTGMGAVSPLGNTAPLSWQAAKVGVSGASLLTEFDVSNFATKIYAGIKQFEPLASGALNAKDLRRLDPFMHYGIVAAFEAMQDSGLVVDEEYASRYGVMIGSGVGGLLTIERARLTVENLSPRKVSPFYIPGSIINMPSGIVSQKLNFQGPNLSMVSACASGTHCLGFAARTIAYGDADVILAGATEHGSTPTAIAGFNAARALSKRNDAPEQASRPWDKQRDGFVLGDGAAVLMLEEYEHAKARNATVYAELLGFGMSGDAHHMTAAEPTGRGFIASMQHALSDAGILASQVDYVNAHGTSTPLADPIEHHAVKSVFAAHADNLLMSSTKSMTGHLLGASGALEAVFSVLAIRDNVAPPTINLDDPEDGCDMNLVAHEALDHTINVVLSNSFGFGGTNASLVFCAV